MKSRLPYLIFLLTMGISFQFLIAQTENAPPSVAAALTIKLAAFEKHIMSADSISIYVIGSEDVAVELQKGIGSRIGNGTLKSVQYGNILPVSPPSILFIGEHTNLDSALAFTHQHHLLSVTHISDLVQKGVTLGLSVGDDGKPLIKLNLTSTIEEQLSWNPAIMKVAKTVK